MVGIDLEKDFHLTEEDELKEIEIINEHLKTLERLINNIEDKMLYHPIISQGSIISELILRLYLKKEGYGINNKHASFGYLISFCIKENLLPKSCINFLKIIKDERNKTMHTALEVDDDVLETFLETLNYFLIWFNEFYSQKYSVKKPFQINPVSSLIYSLLSDEETLDSGNDILEELDMEKSRLDEEEKNLNEEINTLTNKFKDSTKTKEPYADYEMIKNIYVETYKEKGNIESSQNYLKEINHLKERLEKNRNEQEELGNSKLKAILEKLEKKVDILDNKLEGVSETAKRIEEKVDILLNKIDNIMGNLQSFTTRQILNADSKGEIEKIIENYTMEYVEKVTLEYSKNISKKEDYKKEKRKLQISLEENAWNKLSDKSKTFLITSKVMYSDLILIDEISDYSGVCILVAKALEVEMFNRFYTDFIKYLKGKYGADYSKYHSTLIHTGMNNKKSIIFEKNFYMGTVVYLLSPKKDKNKKKSQIKHDEKVLLDYCKNCILSNKNEKEIINILDEYAEDIKKIKNKYRNPSAHRNAIQRVNAEECFKVVLDYEKLLKKMLDSFDY